MLCALSRVAVTRSSETIVWSTRHYVVDQISNCVHKERIIRTTCTFPVNLAGVVAQFVAEMLNESLFISITDGQN